MSGPLGFLVRNIHLATRNSKFQTDIEPECDEDFFSLHLNLGATFWNKIELLSWKRLGERSIRADILKSSLKN